MLLQLNIDDFALIEKLSINFEKGFNVLTGETGAGKSILIDAINYVLGSKFNKDIIRTGKQKTYVEAVFSIENTATLDVLNNLNLTSEDILIISRETFASGRSIAKVNNKTVLVSQLKEISETLLDIHGQHENQNLLDVSKHILYLDSFGKAEINGLIKEYKDCHVKYMEIKSKLEELKGKDFYREKRIDYLRYVIDEIDKYNLKPGEDLELQNKYNIINNSQKIKNVLEYSYGILHETGGDNISVYEALGLVMKELHGIQDKMNDIQEINNNLQEYYYGIENIIQRIRELNETTYYDKEELDSINERLYRIESLKKKYGESIEDILSFRKKSNNELEEFSNMEEILEKYNKEENRYLNLLLALGDKLHTQRIKISSQLEKKIKEELKYVGLERCIFKIQITKNEKFNINGIDNVEFLISTNPGDPLKPLQKIVSGGELSRIMLALKSAFVDKDKIPSIIFDEIDTGISGRIAQSVGEKMYAISSLHQVFCITHLPQIACMSDNHYLVSKSIQENMTYTKVNKLNYNEKLYEISKMIGGSEITKITTENAREMIKIADNKKKEIVLKS